MRFHTPGLLDQWRLLLDFLNLELNRLWLITTFFRSCICSESVTKVVSACEWRRRCPTASPGVAPRPGERRQDWHSCRQEWACIPAVRNGISCRCPFLPTGMPFLSILSTGILSCPFLSTGMHSCRQEYIPVDRNPFLSTGILPSPFLSTGM